MSDAPRRRNEPCSSSRPSGPSGVTRSPSRRRGVRLRSFMGALELEPVNGGSAALEPVGEGPFVGQLTGVFPCPLDWLLTTVFLLTSTGSLRMASRFDRSSLG